MRRRLKLACWLSAARSNSLKGLTPPSLGKDKIQSESGASQYVLNHVRLQSHMYDWVSKLAPSVHMWQRRDVIVSKSWYLSCAQSATGHAVCSMVTEREVNEEWPSIDVSFYSHSDLMYNCPVVGIDGLFEGAKIYFGVENGRSLTSANRAIFFKKVSRFLSFLFSFSRSNRIYSASLLSLSPLPCLSLLPMSLTWSNVALLERCGAFNDSDDKQAQIKKEPGVYQGKKCAVLLIVLLAQ